MLKLLDYGKPNPFSSIIGRPRNLAWPVNAYRVTLPRVLDDGDRLNAFERVILKLLEVVGVMNADALADETRIPLDLVKSVLLRLQDKDLIDEHHAVIEREREEERAPVFVTALVLRELATGKILPFLHLLDTSPLEKQSEEAQEKKRPYEIRWNNAHKQQKPAPRDVINALRAMKKRAAAFGSDNKMPAVQQITIADAPETYHLDCPIAIQKSDGEFRIADPFGNGFSLILENAFEKLLEQEESLTKWLRDWKQSLSTPRQKNQDATPKEPFDSDANLQRYPNLIANLRPSRDNPFRSIAQIHASIEWALFYTCCRRPVESVTTTLKFTAHDQHPALLEQAAKAIGLEPSPGGFKPIREGKLREFKDGGAYQETVFAIALLQAQDDVSHPLRRLASAHPDLINRLLAINAKRNEKAHGKGGADAPQSELSDDLFMREVIHMLLPDLTFVETSAASADRDRHADDLLDSRSSIQNEFGFKAYNRLSANLQERLVHAERFWLNFREGDNALGFAVDLYAATQARFLYRLADRSPLTTPDSGFMSAAKQNAEDNGLGELTDALSTVKLTMVLEALQSGKSTLGACALAFLFVTDAETLCSVAESQPSFITDLSTIINLRGHGNEPLYLPKEDVAKLRKAALSTIKTLMEH